MGKSDLHNELSQKALVWLEGRATQRGIRGCEEVILKEGYVADSAAICGLSLSHEKTFLGEYRNGKTWQSTSDDYVFVFESKVSRADFQNTFKRDGHFGSRLNPVGNFHFVVTPKGLVTPDEVPLFWGLLEKSGAGLAIRKMPQYIPIETPTLHEVAYCLLRSKHESKFAIFEEQANEFRLHQLETDKLNVTT
jgi:hypothetical protein